MSILGFIKKQFIDVIDWTEDEDGVLVYRYPMEDREIQNGGQLTVRDSQLALFVNEGEVADVLEPGLHTLNTRTLPVMTSLHNWDKAFKSPFKSDVYFFSTREQIDQKWGTSTPVTVRDKEFGPVRIRAYGTYSYQIKNPKVFYKKISGTRDQYTVQELEGQLRAAIMTTLATFFGSAEIPFLDMAANQSKFSDTLKEALALTFANYGLAVQTFYVQSISMPDELQAYLDKRASMNIMGDLQKYTQFQAADSISKAAESGNSTAGAGVGLAAGMAMGQTMANAMTSGLGASSGSGGEDPGATLGKLHELLTKGILTQAEFDSKKAELLKKIT